MMTCARINVLKKKDMAMILTTITIKISRLYDRIKIVVTHKLSLELLKRINDLDYVVSIKAAPYSAGASSDF